MVNKPEELPKVLVVDDDAEMVYLASILLEQCGYQSDTAMDAKAQQDLRRDDGGSHA